MKHLTRLLAMLPAIFIAGCGGSKPVSSPNQSFDEWADKFTAEWVRESPQMATRLKYFSGSEQDALDRQMSMIGEWDSPFGEKAWSARIERSRRGITVLDEFDPKSLTPEQQTSAALIRWTLEDVAAYVDFKQHPYMFDQFGGLQLELINHLTQTMALKSTRDVENYLTRLRLVSVIVDQGIAEAKAAESAGIVPPRIILQRSIEQLDGFLKTKARDNVFVSTMEKRAGANASPASIAVAEMIVTESIIPAYRRIRDLLADQMTRADQIWGKDDVGVWRLPKGDAYYKHRLAEFTTTNMTAEEIHAIGLKEVARLEAEMDTILKQLGYTQGTVQHRFEQADKDAQPPATPDPRPKLLAEHERILRDAEQRSAPIFDMRPKAPVEVRREPPFSEKTAAAHYTDPATDGSRPGIFWVPLPGPTFEMLRMRSLTYHETVPGHHYQIALQQEIPGLPRYRQLGIFGFNSAYVEGWALYAERLADENNWYEGDPKGRLGYLEMQLFRARRLVVDTGIHAMHWTRQQAIDYGIDATEVERYIAYPGQACSYMVGQLKIIELREKARAALGSKFSIREFHNVVLRSGSVPLSVLEQNVGAWITQAH
jgi:uncharacterized protein (DUF885 family)